MHVPSSLAGQMLQLYDRNFPVGWLARMGEPTLLIDADFRTPGLHRAFGLRNRAGLADFLEGGGARLAHCAENLSVLVAGRSAEDPLELLGRPRMRELLAAAARRYRAVLVDTPSAARGPANAHVRG